MSGVVVIGSSNTDMVVKTQRFPAPGETVFGGEFLMTPGGKGANQAVAAARLGVEVTFIAKVGNDLFGREAVAGFEKEGINTDYISVDLEAASGVANILVDRHGENCIAVASGANGALSSADIDCAMVQIEKADVLLMQLETLVPTIEHAAKMGRRMKKLVVLNPAPALALSGELLRNVDIITPNETEAEILSGIRITDQKSMEEAARTLRDRGVGAVVITLGARGAYIQSEEITGIVPALKVVPVDTTAAGDTFNGALAVGLANRLPLDAAVRFASRASAVSVTRMGAQLSAPYLNEIESDFC